MNRVETSVYIATTLDGFIARPDDGIDWLEHDSGGEDYGYQRFRDTLDTLVLGRRSYDKVLSFGVPWPYAGLRTVVWSRTLTTEDIPAALREEGVEVSALPPSRLLAELAGRGLKHAWIDGGATVQAFLAAGEIDVISVTRMPILIGQGLPLFGALPADMRLDHLNTTAFTSGVVQSSYAVLS
jgi:dihydrofolate reductase